MSAQKSSEGNDQKETQKARRPFNTAPLSASFTSSLLAGSEHGAAGRVWGALSLSASPVGSLKSPGSEGGGTVALDSRKSSKCGKT